MVKVSSKTIIVVIGSIVILILSALITRCSLSPTSSSVKYNRCLSGVALLAEDDRPKAIEFCNKYLDKM